jgi:hypothetical protein
MKGSDGWRHMSRKMRLLVALLLVACWLDQADTIRWL